MNIGQRIFGALMSRMLERSAMNKTYDDLITQLSTSEAAVSQRVVDKHDTPANRKQMGHIIGIERWSQRRLQTLLGEPVVQDEYDGYRPSPSEGMDTLRRDFEATRHASIEIARQLKRRNIPTTATVKHNDAGDISAGAWLSYINSHTNREIYLVR